MNYSETFNNQWRYFVNNFSAFENKYKIISTNSANEWYKSNSLKWKSEMQTEGISLKKQSEELQSIVLSRLDSFSFKDVSLAKSKKPNYVMIILIVVAILISVGLCFVGIRILYKILSIVLLLALAVCIGLKGIINANKKYADEIKNNYKLQLEDLGKEITEICKNNE